MKSGRFVTSGLLIRGAQLTEKVTAWKIKDHPHTVAGNRRGFEVRIYHYPAQGWLPYFVTLISEEGWVMDGIHSPTAAAAEAAALEVLSDLSRGAGDTRRPDPSSETAQMDRAYGERVEHITGALIAAIEANGATYPQAKHALTGALGALLGGNSETDADRAAAVSVASGAIAA